jgi:hypothetical protein
VAFITAKHNQALQLVHVWLIKVNLGHQVGARRANPLQLQLGLRKLRSGPQLLLVRVFTNQRLGDRSGLGRRHRIQPQRGRQTVSVRVAARRQFTGRCLRARTLLGIGAVGRDLLFSGHKDSA